MTVLPGTIHDSYYQIGGLIDESGVALTAIDYLAVPGGGSLIAVVYTVVEEVATEDLVLTFSTVTAGGVATAVTGGVVTVPFAGTTIRFTVETAITAHATTVIPDGGSLKLVVTGGANTAGILKVGVIIRRK